MVAAAGFALPLMLLKGLTAFCDLMEMHWALVDFYPGCM